ncbi:MAG TPA: hypothetical protein DIT25_00540 [Candidatus Moranbacteria bacterium]|nr:hypothetical protein [Candidatus Moranbacteria bacterium]
MFVNFMNWIIIAIFAYLLIAVQTMLDKFLISSKKVSHASVYAFYSGILSFFTLFIFAPFDFHLITIFEFFLAMASGMIFAYGILNLFFAINKSQASQAIPVVGAVTPVATYVFSVLFFGENISQTQFAGVSLLIFGGLFISFDLPLKLNKKKFFDGFYHSAICGILLGVSFSAFKYLYDHDTFANMFIWSRLGLFAGALSFLLHAGWRKKIVSSFRNFKGDKKQNSRTSALFIFNKILGGTGSALANYAISLGSVTLVNALASIQYIFLFLMGAALSLKFPEIFAESGKFWDIAQKVAAVGIITAGIILITK